MKVLVITLLFASLSYGSVAPPFQGDLLGGGKTSLKQRLQKNRTLLVCFWASWCMPCLQELKSVLSKMKENSNLPLDLLTVNVDTQETSTDVKPILKLYNFEMPVILDPKHEIFSKYQESKQLPFSVLVSSNGEIAKTFSGYHEEMFQTVKEIITHAK